MKSRKEREFKMMRGNSPGTKHVFNKDEGEKSFTPCRVLANFGDMMFILYSFV